MLTVGWVRDHGGAPLVNAAENWYYTRHAPSTTAPGAAALSFVPGAASLVINDRGAITVGAWGRNVTIGPHLNLPTLARAMTEAGIVTGMQLDINSGMVTYIWWTPGHAGAVLAHRLLPAKSERIDRYLVADQRDSLYVTAR